MKHQSPKKVLFTFDYELFLGSNSGSFENCISIPLDKILKLFSKNNLQIVFFLDVLYYETAKNQIHYKEEFHKLQTQLIQLLQQGHIIFPHIHSHWLDAEYQLNTKTWNLSNTTKYRFQSINENLKKEIFDLSINTIKELQEMSNVFYPIHSFRAGGWCIQPFEDFKPYFKKYGIKYDLSVIPGHHYVGEIQQYDFSNIKETNLYKFENDPNEINLKGSFTEIPITTYSWNLKFFTKLNKINTVLRDKTNLKHFKYFGDGKIANHSGEKFTPKEIGNLSIENLNWITFFKYLVTTYKSDFVHFISHSKTITPHNLVFLKLYLKFLRKFFKVKNNYFEIIKS